MNKHIHNSLGVAIASMGALAISPLAAAQGFTHQDLYLASPALPLPGGGYGIGILRIDPATWSETFIAPPPGYEYQARPAYDALRTLLARVGDTTFIGRIELPAPFHALRFRRPDASEIAVAWSAEGESEIELPFTWDAAESRDGEPLECAPPRANLGRSPVYFTGVKPTP